MYEQNCHANVIKQQSPKSSSTKPNYPSYSRPLNSSLDLIATVPSPFSHHHNEILHSPPRARCLLRPRPHTSRLRRRSDHCHGLSRSRPHEYLQRTHTRRFRRWPHKPFRTYPFANSVSQDPPHSHTYNILAPIARGNKIKYDDSVRCERCGARFCYK